MGAEDRKSENQKKWRDFENVYVSKTGVLFIGERHL